MQALEADNKALETQTALRRIVDLTTPNLPSAQGVVRSENRQNRSLPVLLVPLDDGRPCTREATTAITKDVSDHGVSLVMVQPYRAQEVVVGFWLGKLGDPTREPAPQFFYGRTRQCTEIGGGFWQLGLELTGVAGEPEVVAQLKPVAMRLVSQGRSLEFAAE